MPGGADSNAVVTYAGIMHFMRLQDTKIQCASTVYKPIYIHSAAYIMQEWQKDFAKVAAECDAKYDAAERKFVLSKAAGDKSKTKDHTSHASTAEHERVLFQLCEIKKHRLDALYASGLRGPTLMAARIVFANAC